jgi:hypothetical protein
MLRKCFLVMLGIRPRTWAPWDSTLPLAASQPRKSGAVDRADRPDAENVCFYHVIFPVSLLKLALPKAFLCVRVCACMCASVHMHMLFLSSWRVFVCASMHTHRCYSCLLAALLCGALHQHWKTDNSRLSAKMQSVKIAVAGLCGCSQGRRVAVFPHLFTKT